MVKKLADVHPAELTHDQWITYSDLLFDVTGTADADRYFWFVTPVTPYSSPLRVLTTPFESFQFKTATDARDVPRRAQSGPDRDRRVRGEAARSDAARHRAAGRRDSARPAVRADAGRRAAAERVQRRGVEGECASERRGRYVPAQRGRYDPPGDQPVDPASSDVHRLDVSRARAGWRRREPVCRRRRLLPVSHSSAHRARSHAAADSGHRCRRDRAARRRAGEGARGRRLQRLVRRVPHVPQDRPAVFPEELGRHRRHDDGGHSPHRAEDRQLLHADAEGAVRREAARRVARAVDDVRLLPAAVRGRSDGPVSLQRVAAGVALRADGAGDDLPRAHSRPSLSARAAAREHDALAASAAT